MTRTITAAAAALCGIAAAVSAASVQAWIPPFPYIEFFRPAGRALDVVFSYAAWYIPIFYLLLAVALLRGHGGRKLFFSLLVSLIPFLTAVVYLHILFSGDSNPVSAFLSSILTRRNAAYITGVVLILQLAVFLLGILGSLRQRQQNPSSVTPASPPPEKPAVEYVDDGNPELRFPSVPDVPELNSFRQKFSRMQEDADEPVYQEEDEVFLENGSEDGVYLDDEESFEQQEDEFWEDVPLKSAGSTGEDVFILDEDDLIEEFAPGDLEQIDTPILPPEDPNFQNEIIHRELEKDEIEEIDRDWIRREEDKPLTRKKSPAKTALSYTQPSEELLSTYPEVSEEGSAYTQEAAAALMQTFKEFGIEAKLTGIQKGPVVTMFEILPAPGVRVSSITNLSDNIALQLAASRVRIVAPIPGKQAVGIEVPNRKRSIVSFREMLASMDEHSHYKIPMVLGKDIMGALRVIDLVRTPHLLIAGATGSGKSVCVNALICSILYRRSPKDVRLMLIDPKIVELKLYNDIPHLLAPVITEAKKTLKALQYCIYEMERRYKLLDALGVRDISSYNAKIKTRNLTAEHLPYIVVIIDEFADLMSTIGKELEHYLARLAAMARAIGIHLVLATQRPSTNVITGLIKANIPSRIAFMVVSNTDSRIIIDMPGAEKLLGKGDMLFLSSWEAYPTRIQGSFLSEEEVERVVEQVKANGEPDYLDESYFLDDDENGGEEYEGENYEDDPLMGQALRIVQERSVASASMLQRRLKIGYNRAARLIEMMEEMGIVGPAQGSKPRDVIRYQDPGDV